MFYQIKLPFQQYMWFRKLILVFYFLLLSLIISAQNIGTTASSETNTDFILKKGQIAAVTLLFSNWEDAYKVELMKIKFIESNKKFHVEYMPWKENDFIGLVVDDAEMILDTIHIDQPLNIRYEYPHDDMKTLGITTVDLTENDVLIRFPYVDSMIKLRIFRVGAEKRLELIDTLSLQKKK